MNISILELNTILLHLKKTPSTFTIYDIIVLDVDETKKYYQYMDNSCFISINNRIVTMYCVYIQLKQLFN